MFKIVQKTRYQNLSEITTVKNYFRQRFGGFIATGVMAGNDILSNMCKNQPS